MEYENVTTNHSRQSGIKQQITLNKYFDYTSLVLYEGGRRSLLWPVQLALDTPSMCTRDVGDASPRVAAVDSMVLHSSGMCCGLPFSPIFHCDGKANVLGFGKSGLVANRSYMSRLRFAVCWPGACSNDSSLRPNV